MSRRRRPELDPHDDDAGDLRRRRSTLTSFSAWAGAADPPLPATNPLVLFAGQWRRARYEAMNMGDPDGMAMARAVALAESWIVELGLDEMFAQHAETRRHPAGTRERNTN